MAVPHQFVVIGASFAGLTIAHGLLRDILPTVSNRNGQRYKVILINPTEEFLWKVGVPRVLVKPAVLPLEKALLPILPAFEKYDPQQFEFVKAYATRIDPASRTIQLSTQEAVRYDSLVICSGTNASTNIWSTTPGSDALRVAIQNIHDRLPNAQAVLVAGGGPAGVETAGELGEVYGGQKDIMLLSGTTNLLNSLNNKKIGQDAEEMLKSMGVKVTHNVRVSSHEAKGEQELVRLSNGETKTVDVYIEAVGDRPNSSFVPVDWRDETGRVKCNPQTLRLNVDGVANVYCYGAVGSYSDGSIVDIAFGKKSILESIKLDLEGHGKCPLLHLSQCLRCAEPGPRTNNVYKKNTSDWLAVPIGSTQGVGALFGWRLPSFFIRMVKSKDFMIGNAAKYLEGAA